MAISITPNGHRNGQVDDEDIWRARDAAETVLAAHGVTPEDAFGAYREQWDKFDDEERMTGPARIWIEARLAADIALTATWANPNAEIFCDMSA